MTVSEAAAEWDEFFYNKLKDQALSGLFSENGSPNYWYRTWPAIFNLADLGSPRVRQRARMFIDLAFVEGEALQMGGFRAGAKMRAKKDGGDYPVYSAKGVAAGSTSSIVVYQAGMGRCAGDGMKPVLLGDGGPSVWEFKDGESFDSPPVWWPHFATAVIEMQTSTYNMSSTVIMLRARTAAQKAAAAPFTLQNRLLGETNETDPAAGLSLNSSIVHNFYATESFGLGSIFFDPSKNKTLGAPPQESMVELNFANEFHSTVGIPHSSGPKWSAQEGGALIAAQCSGSLGCIARYAGDFATEIYNVSAVHVRGDWIVIEPANGLQAWGAVRYAWGGLNASASSVKQGVTDSGNHSFLLVPADPWSPLVLFAGNASTFGSLGRFIRAVLAAEFSASKPAADGTRVVTFVPPAGDKPCPEFCRPMKFPWSLDQAKLKAPSIGGKPMEDQPAMAYNSPFMRSTLGSDTVRTSSGPGGAIQEVFDFSTDTVKRVGVGAMKSDDSSAVSPTNFVLMMSDDTGWGDMVSQAAERSLVCTVFLQFLLRSLAASLRSVLCVPNLTEDRCLQGYNNGTASTPHLDAWSTADSAIKFERFYAGSPICSPTRASFLTGRTPWRDCVSQRSADEDCI
eukprot:SAG22_NODE_64_length_23238_cov_83.185566_13_plen_624_part_00